MFIKTLKQQISTDDGYKPFSNNDYEIKWIDNNVVEITYGFGNANVYKKESVKFNINNKK